VMSRLVPWLILVFLLTIVFARERAMNGKRKAMPAGKQEGCRLCHSDLTGFERAHSPEAVGCVACHGGEAFSLRKDSAHQGMAKSPGLLENAQGSCDFCHPGLPRRVRNSLMATNAGIIALDSRVFQEEHATPGTMAEIATSTVTPARSHIRKLCAGCHLGLERGRLYDEHQQGGCLACHLEARLGNSAARKGGKVHPRLSLTPATVRSNACEACHSRSSRISLCYRGYADEEGARATGKSFKYFDGRPFALRTPDVHHMKGLDCIDCHTAREIMGDGARHTEKREALDVTCADCHRPERLVSLSPEGPDFPGERRLIAARGLTIREGREFPLTRRGTLLYNVFRDPDISGGAAAGYQVPWTLALKRSRRTISMKPFSSKPWHTLEGHRRLDCQACHTTWASSCASCHSAYRPEGSQYDWLAGRPTPGEWTERHGPYVHGLPALGLSRGRVRPFVPGMILTLDTGSRRIAGRYFAPTEPHTTGKARSCASCHREPRMLETGPTLRAGGRAFTIREKERILLVGSCVPCHREYGDPIFRNFSISLDAMGPSCRSGDYLKSPAATSKARR
jgi:hypothetical protein